MLSSQLDLYLPTSTALLLWAKSAWWTLGSESAESDSVITAASQEGWDTGVCQTRSERQQKVGLKTFRRLRHLQFVNWKLDRIFSVIKKREKKTKINDLSCTEYGRGRKKWSKFVLASFLGNLHCEVFECGECVHLLIKECLIYSGRSSLKLILNISIFQCDFCYWMKRI